MSAVANIVFPNDIAWNAIGGPRFSTIVAPSTSGYEQRNANWDMPKRRWEIGHDITSETKLQTLLSFFHARQGKAYGFLFQDWGDYTVGMTFVSDVLTFTSYQQFATGDGATTVFQLNKVYADSVAPFTRKITRPMPGGKVRIYLGAVLKTETTDYTINYTTGLVTFAVAPANTTVINWAGQFYVPARFDTDDMQYNLQNIHHGEWHSVPIVEIKE